MRIGILVIGAVTTVVPACSVVTCLLASTISLPGYRTSWNTVVTITMVVRARLRVACFVTVSVPCDCVWASWGTFPRVGVPGRVDEDRVAVTSIVVAVGVVALVLTASVANLAIKTVNAAPVDARSVITDTITVEAILAT